MSGAMSALDAGLSSSRDRADRPSHPQDDYGRDMRGGGGYNSYNSSDHSRHSSSNNYHSNRSRRGGRGGYNGQYYNSNGGRYHGRGYRDDRPPPPPGGPGYDRALQAQRPRFGSTLGGRGRGRGQRLPGNVKERTNQVFVSEQVMLSKEIITRLGDFRSDPNDPAQMISDMREMAEVLTSTNDLKQFRDDMSELFTKCMSQLSVQGPLIATLLALISKSNNEFPLFVVKKMVSTMHGNIARGEILHAKLTLRCLCVLASVGALALTGEGGFESLIGTIVSAAEPVASVKSGFFTFSQQAMTYLLATSTPYMAALVSHSSGDLAKRCRAVFQRVLKEWKSPYDTDGKNAVFNVNTIMLEDPTQGPEDMACWDTLWEACLMAVQVLDGEAAASDAVGPTVTDGLHVHSSSYKYPTCFLRPWTEVTDDMTKPFVLAEIVAEDESAAVLEGSASEDTPVVASLEASPPEKVPVLEGGLLRFDGNDTRILAELLASSELESTLRIGCSQGTATMGKGVFSWLCARFPIFDAETGPHAATCVGLSYFEKYFMSDVFRDIFFFFQPYIRDYGTHIGTVDQVALHQLAAFKLFSDSSEVHLEYILVETLLLLIVQVPPACASGVCRLILELCKKNAKIPPAVASVTGVLAQLFPAMDSTSWRNITAWMSSHLANTKLAWPFWDYWSEEYAGSAEDSVHRAFIRLLVEQCSRALPAQRLRIALPDAIHKAILEDFSPADELFTDAVDIDDPFVTVAKNVYQKIESREDPDELQEWLEETHDGVDDALQTENWRVSVLVKALLICGSRKTLSQLVSLIDKYRDVLREMGESDEAQRAIMESCMSVMGHDLGFAAIVLDVIIRRGVLKPVALAAKICGDEIMDKLAVDNCIFSLTEIAVDRSLDIAQALVAKKKMLIGKGISMEADESIISRPKDYSGAVTHVMSMGGGPSTPGEKETPPGEAGDEAEIAGAKRSREEKEDVEDGDDEDARSSRRRKFDENKDRDASAIIADENITGPAAELTMIETTLATALKDCRTIYSKILITLILRLSRRQKELSATAAASEEDNLGGILDPWCMTALSLIRTSLRSFHVAQDILDHSGDGENKVCDVDSVLFEISDVELTPQLKSVWETFSGCTL